MASVESLCIKNARVVFPGEQITRTSVTVRDGRIVSIGSQDEDCETVIDADGALLTPGLIDVHTHGIKHYRYEVGPEELMKAASELAAFGCTCAFPTVIGRPSADFIDLLGRTCTVLPKVEAACIPGVHLEGPFLAHTGAGCTTVPGDLSLLQDLLDAGQSRVSAMSISPEVENIIPVIERLREANVRVFITHTGATLEETQKAIDAGAHHATHFYDVFYPQPETDLGVRPVACVEAILADRRVTADFICDGVHVEPTAIRMTLYAKGWQNVMLVTDSNVGAGLPPGEYDTPWGFRIYAHPDKAARIIGDHKYAGALAGSALTMNRGVDNLRTWFGDQLGEDRIWAMATANPARLMGLEQKGRIAEGADADLVLWKQHDGTLVPKQTWVAGESVFADRN